MKEQLLEAWQTHNQMNLLLCNNISDTGMGSSLSTKGGRTVYQQLAHLHNVRLQWLEVSAPDIARNCKVIDKNAAYNKKELTKALQDSAKAMAELFSKSWDAGGRIKSFKKGLLSFFAYFISHESHHRGSIMLTLKQKGEKIPDSIKWGLWEWGK